MLNFRTYYQRVGVLDVDVDQSVNTIERAEVLCRRGLTARRVCRPDGKRTLPTRTGYHTQRTSLLDSSKKETSLSEGSSGRVGPARFILVLGLF